MTLPGQGAVPPQELLTALAGTGLTWEDMTGPSHRRHVVAARHALMGLLRRRGWSYASIGDLFGERDPKTVHHACHKHDAIRERYARVFAGLAP